VGYFNVVLKTYNRGRHENLRFIHFENLHRRATDENDRLAFLQSRAGKCIENAESSETSEGQIERDYKTEAICRAKKVVKEIVRHNLNKNLKLLTLTYSYIVSSREAVLSDVKQMARRYKARFGVPLRYIATLEWQSGRNCLHVHMVIDSEYIPADQWQSDLWRQGFVKINTITHGKSKSDCLNAVAYVLKYITKDTKSAQYYNHLYFRSKNWNTNIRKEYFTSSDESAFFKIANIKFGFKKYDHTRFFFESHDGYIITIHDFYSDTS